MDKIEKLTLAQLKLVYMKLYKTQPRKRITKKELKKGLLKPLGEYKMYATPPIKKRKTSGEGKERTPLKRVQGGNAVYENREMYYNNQTFDVSILKLEPGVRLYNASLRGLNTEHNGWFGIKKEDIGDYGPLVQEYVVIKPIYILDFDDMSTKDFIRALLLEDPRRTTAFEESWGGNRHTTRENDFLVANHLKFVLPNYGIFGFGTGRGMPYLEAPDGHHAEICLFPDAYDSLSLVEQTRKENIRATLNSLDREQAVRRREEIARRRAERRSSSRGFGKRLFDFEETRSDSIGKKLF